VILRFVVAAYFVALAAMPFAHHDLVCHLKSNTHCVTCHVGTSADPPGAQPAVTTATLADVGRADDRPLTVLVGCVLSPSAGRAPPAHTISAL